MHLAAEMTKSLASLTNNTPANVVEIRPNSLAPRLVEMGLCKGIEVRILFRAPFSGPIAVDLGESVLSLRLDEAELVIVKEKNKG